MGEWLNHLLTFFPPILCYILVALVIGLESMGVPLPGEITLIGAVLLSFEDPRLHILTIAVSAAIGAIVGDSCGYFIGLRWGKKVLSRLGQKFPQHFAEERITHVQELFHRHGVWAIFFGRFVALLRVLSGPIAGTLHIKYWKFLIANVLGGIAWVSVVTSLVTILGKAAEKYVSRSSWIILLAIAVLALSLWLRKRWHRH